jgi:arylformamidase
MDEKRVVCDFEMTFANGGGIQGQGFRLDIDKEPIADDELADYLVRDMNLLMVSNVQILNKRYVTEPHKRQIDSDHGLADLSHPIRDGMVTYPGIPAPVIRNHLSREESRQHYAEGTEFYIAAIDLVANTGTYIDAPFHRYPDGSDISDLPLERLVGLSGVVVDTDTVAIGPDVFTDTDTRGKAVLIRTGWDSRFGQEDYVGEHPHLTTDGARRLIEGGASLVGIDSSNIDDTSRGHRPAHSLLLDAGIPVVEHLTNLDQIPETPFEFFAIPAPVVGMTSFPVRAVARW